MSLIYIIEDEPIMADCIAAAVAGVAQEPNEIAVFNDGVSAMEAVNNRLPDVILLDVMLTGPDGFAFLNEMISYPDTAKVPVILISSLDLSHRNLEHYGVVRVLDKAKMTPDDIYTAIQDALAGVARAAAEAAIAASTPAPVSEPVAPTPSLPAQPTIQENQTPATPLSLDDFKQRLANSAGQEPHAE